MAKPWWKSKTFWFNVLMAVAAVAAQLRPIIDDLVAAGYDADWVAPVRAAIAFATIIGNMILRAVTTGPVTLR